VEYTTQSKESKMTKQQKTYTREFKVEAVQLVKSSRKSMSQVARELGISDSALSKWCKQVVEQGNKPFRAVGIRPPEAGGAASAQAGAGHHPAGARHFKKVVSIFSRESR
jgi:transposase-like protein